jgi:aspartate aminotransferase-like enzyme
MNTRPVGFGTFFVPGPTEVRGEVLQAMAQPMIAHRGPVFRELFRRVQRGLQVVFGTEQPILITTSSATGLMEAAIRNAPIGRILALVNGGFSERFAHIAVACGRSVDRYEVPWGSVHEVAEVTKWLRTERYSIVTVVHSETSTGALNDVRAISDAAHEAGAVCCIDSVSGVRGAELRFDAWHLDYVFTGSQKAIAAPPGLAFAVASPAFLANGLREGRGLYFDLTEVAAAAKRGEAPNTPAIPIYYALDTQLGAVLAEGLEAAWARHRAMADLTARWVQEMRESTGLDISIVARESHRSPTVTAIALPAELTPEMVMQGAASRGYTLGSGYGKLKESTVRIGHMGEHTVSGVARCLDAIGDVIACREDARVAHPGPAHAGEGSD